MQRRSFIAATGVALIVSSLPTFAANQKPLELFGVTLKGASRDQLRQAIKQSGMHATREDNSYWVDTYDPLGVLEGATNFNAGYVAATGRFAFAQYTFSTFMDTQLVTKVINMVSTKYGGPDSLTGNAGLGPVTAKWNVGQGMQITVSRGWPDTTTYLLFTDAATNSQMLAEIEAHKKADATQKAKAQTKAF
jgi:hypothetical protein